MWTKHKKVFLMAAAVILVIISVIAGVKLSCSDDTVLMPEEAQLAGDVPDEGGFPEQISDNKADNAVERDKSVETDKPAQAEPTIKSGRPKADIIEATSDNQVSIKQTPIVIDHTSSKEDKKDKESSKSEGSSNSNNGTVSKPVIPDTSIKEDITGLVGADDKLTESVTMTSAQGVQAIVPVGVKVESNVKELKLSVTEKTKTDSDVTVEKTEKLDAYDVHIEGIASDNKTPITIELGEVLSPGLNKGNLSLYHVENNKTVKMTEVNGTDEFTAHNQFTYEPQNGALAVAVVSFSEITVVSDTKAKWEGEYDYSWYNTTDTSFVIANADQLAGFGAIVGGMAKDAEGNVIQDSFKGKNVKLINNINLGDAESENNSDIIFYPIGYYNSTGSYDKVPDGSVTSNVSSFEGTFDGNGHTISNFYQNTWEMFGDYNDGYPAGSNYYKDAMGLFGYVAGGTVKNLTVDHFSSDGEFTPTGVIAAYAADAIFENIAITNCNPRVYNTGNGGIVGIGGNSDDTRTENFLKFTNITIDNTNKISALWGSWDVACGGLMGMFRGYGDVKFTNCHVAAQIDVYNDVCGNYQYYWYRYAGMMIGSLRGRNTVENGYTVPDMTGITAEGCTVHFGEWNDYYYCELVANSLASYTHDHQFSRLEQISNLDEIKSGDAWTKAGNFLLISEGTKNCYHIVEKDGVLSLHKHEDTGKETVDGETVLKEDKQIVYLPFNQLFQGDGWGVKHIPIYDDGTGFDGITILGRESNSVRKFEQNADFNNITDGDVVYVGAIFTAIENILHPIDNDNVQVTVSPVGEDSTAAAEYDADTNDWKNGTLAFTGTGEATITITDYYFCTPTTINVTVAERTAAEKFLTKFTNDYLYRVGNENEISLGSLFETVNDEKIGAVSVSIEAVDETNASGTYTSKTEWENGTIQFTGTGIVKVIIKDDDKYCKPTELYLEVVDGMNATSALSAKNNNVVLLNDINGGFTVSNGHSFYGNGFEVKCLGDGSYKSKALSYGFVTVETGGVLDNVKIVCDIFPESYLYTVEMKEGTDGRYPYGYSAVVISGNSTISNCYIYGARNNILVNTGNVMIENTVTECGSLSNIQIKSTNANTVTLNNVITIQYQTTSKYDTSKKVMGFGVVVGDNESASNPKIKLSGDFRQYNWVTDADKSISNTYAKTAISEALEVEQYQHTVNGTTTVNMGIAYLNSQSAKITDERNNKDVVPYSYNEIKMNGQTGQVYSITRSEITANSRYDAETDKVIPYSSEKNNCILPDLEFKDSNAAITFNYNYDDTEGKKLGKLSIDLDNITGGSYTFSFNNLFVKKYGKNLEFLVKDLDGTPVDKDTEIVLNQLMTNEYTLTVTDGLIYAGNGEKTTSEVTHEIPFILAATKTSIDPPKFNNKGTATAIRLVSSAGGDWRPAYTALTGVTVDYWSASESKVKKVDLSTLYNSGTINSNVWTYTCDDYTLTITGGAVHTDGTTITPVVASDTLYFASTNKAFGTGTTSRNIILTYVFTDKNASTTWNRTETVKYSELRECDYDSFKNNGMLTAPSSSCVIPDTLITLADGTQKEVQYLNPGEELLVWNLETGSYDTAPIVFVDSEQETEYEVVYLNFSDGSQVGLIYEHGFFDLNLAEYVYINAENYENYIGHEFVTMGNREQNTWNVATLDSVDVEMKTTTAWSPVTYKHLCYYTDGVLSMPGGISGLFNIFEVDTETMAYDSAQMVADIEIYGLLTYEDFEGMIPLIAYEAFNGEYLNVAIGKGLITWDTIEMYANRYVPLIPSVVADELLGY